MSISRHDTRLTDEIVRDYVAAGYWNGLTFADIIERNAREAPDEVALVDETMRTTWSQLWAKARNLALHLIDMGVRRGDVVGIQLPNRIEFVIALGAASLAGAVACPYLHLLRRSEANFILGFSDAVVTFVPSARQGEFDLVDMTQSLRPGLPKLRQVIVVGGQGQTGEGLIAFEALVSGPPDTIDSHDDLLARSRPGPQDVCRLLFTSGSTGQPKGVLHTYDTSIYNNLRLNELLAITSDSVLLLFLPVTLNLGMFHIFQAALARCRLVLMENFRAPAVVAALQSHRVTCFASPPTGLIALLREPSLPTTDMSALRYVISVGTPCAIDFIKELRSTFGCPVLEGYGMTEAGWIAITDVGDRPEEAVGTVGFPSPWMFARIVDRDGAEVATGVEGEIVLDGPCICVGYFKAPQQNAETWTSDGKFRTGDLGAIDEAGRLRILGRVKDVIKHGGASVYPREIEDLVITHPSVADVAVIGIPDDYFGENICACVVLKQGKSLSIDDLIAFLKDKIAKYKLPQRLVEVASLPYTSTGKVEKHKLRSGVLGDVPVRAAQAARA